MWSPKIVSNGIYDFYVQQKYFIFQYTCISKNCSSTHIQHEKNHYFLFLFSLYSAQLCWPECELTHTYACAGDTVFFEALDQATVLYLGFRWCTAGSLIFLTIQTAITFFVNWNILCNIVCEYGLDGITNTNSSYQSDCFNALTSGGVWWQ